MWEYQHEIEDKRLFVLRWKGSHEKHDKLQTSVSHKYSEEDQGKAPGLRESRESRREGIQWGRELLASSNRDTHFPVIRVNGVRSAQFSVCGWVYAKVLKVKSNRRGGNQRGTPNFFFCFLSLHHTEREREREAKRSLLGNCIDFSW